MQFIIEFQQDHLDKVLEAVRHEVNAPEQMLHKMGESLHRVNSERQAQGLAPDGTKWKALAQSTLAGKGGKGRMLVGYYPNRKGARCVNPPRCSVRAVD